MNSSVLAPDVIIVISAYGDFAESCPGISRTYKLNVSRSVAEVSRRCPASALVKDGEAESGAVINRLLTARMDTGKMLKKPAIPRCKETIGDPFDNGPSKHPVSRPERPEAVEKPRRRRMMNALGRMAWGQIYYHERSIDRSQRRGAVLTPDPDAVISPHPAYTIAIMVRPEDMGSRVRARDIRLCRGLLKDRLQKHHRPRLGKGLFASTSSSSPELATHAMLRPMDGGARLTYGELLDGNDSVQAESAAQLKTVALR